MFEVFLYNEKKTERKNQKKRKKKSNRNRVEFQMSQIEIIFNYDTIIKNEIEQKIEILQALLNNLIEIVEQKNWKIIM